MTFTRSYDHVNMVTVLSGRTTLFGSRLRERILTLLSLVEPVYPRQIANVLDEHLASVQNAVAALQDAGIIASRLIGRTRLVELDRRWFAALELRALLERMAEADPGIRAAAATIRQRPRRVGKPL